MNKTLLEKAKEAREVFVFHGASKDDKERVVRESFYSFKHEAIRDHNPYYNALSKVIRESGLDEDSSYEFVVLSIEAIIELLKNGTSEEDLNDSENSNIEASVYNSDILEWINKGNECFVDDAINNYGWEGVGRSVIQAGQFGYQDAYREVFYSVKQALEQLKI